MKEALTIALSFRSMKRYSLLFNELKCMVRLGCRRYCYRDYVGLGNSLSIARRIAASGAAGRIDNIDTTIYVESLYIVSTVHRSLGPASNSPFILFLHVNRLSS